MSKGWVFLFCASAVCVHFHFLKEKKHTVAGLESRLASMAEEKQKALSLKEDLSAALASQSDPAWIEMVLMRDLGVVPEGFLKVHFKR